MLNISDNTILKKFDVSGYKSFEILATRTTRWGVLSVIIGVLLCFILVLFLPWTQNIRAKGYLTTVRPDQRPQAIQSVISGRLEKWYVQEGDFVNAGDTIVFISEVKPEYFDPRLVERTSTQVDAKRQSIDSYGQKIEALDAQYQALLESRQLKIEQTENKIIQTKFKIAGDSTDLVAFRLNETIAERQFRRTDTLYQQGLKPLTEFEAKRMKWQETQAKVMVQVNKLAVLRNDLAIYNLELSAIVREYADKLAKSRSDRMSALSDQLEAQANTAKLQNQLSNYEIRSGLYHIVAPQSGFITKLVQKGIGEIVKEGTDIVTVMPDKYDLAVELYVRPIDVPLLEMGNEVRIQFDGWPVVVFSGWPQVSFGTFSGEIFAIDRFISENGKYRILVKPNDPDKPWPDLLRVGSGSNSFILLNDVPLWYEVWRQLNGFPPDFYKENNGEKESVKTKEPLRSVK